MATKSALVDCMEFCIVCGAPKLHTHHVFEGTANRRISDKYGYIIPLCLEHHTGRNGIHFNKEFDLAMKKRVQEHFEKNHGNRKKFIETFGRSWM